MVQKLQLLKEIEEKIKDILPDKCGITKVELEGPEVVLYTNNPKEFFSDNNWVSKVAYELKKRVVVRVDKKQLLGKEQAKEIILSLIPEEAEIKTVYFKDAFNEVVIEAVKKGLVIGKGGEISKEIVLQTGWTPKILRVPTSESKTLSGIRTFLHNHADEQRKFLLDTAEQIYAEPSDLKHKYVRLTGLGGYREVGRSSSLLETEQTKTLLDAGVSFSDNDPYPFIDALGYPLGDINATIVSHAHSDHHVMLPYLNKLGFKGPVYCTEPTRDLMALIQFDYIKVNEANEKDVPFSEQDVKNVILRTITRDYREVTDIAPDMRMTLHNAAHILGSSSVHLNIGEGRHNLVYSSDMKYGMTRLFDNIDIKYPRIETLLIESTYGAKDALQTPKQESEQQLLDAIKETKEFGGSVLIPVFGVGRGQELALVIESFYKKGLLDDITVYVDGMVKEASAIHTAYPEYLRKSVERRILTNDSPFDAPIFKDATFQDRDKITKEKGSIILATSGMMNAGPVVDYFQKMASNSANTLIFVGYLAEGSLGRQIQQGLKTMPVSDSSGKTKKLDIKMRVENIDGFSGHSDYNQLMNYVGSLKPKPKRIIVNHGDPFRSVEFSRSVAKKYRIQSTALRILDSVRLR